MTSQSPFSKLEHGEEAFRIFQTTDSRNRASRIVRGPGGEEIWKLMLSAIDAGFLFPNDNVYDRPHLNLLFTAVKTKRRNFFTHYDLSDSADLTKVRDLIFPIALANREAVLANPATLECFVNAADQKLTKELRLEKTLKAMPSTEQEIIIFGARIWPLIEYQSYTYDQARAAVWYFRDLDAWFAQDRSDSSPRSRAIKLRLSTKWVSGYVARSPNSQSLYEIKQIYQIVHHLAGLLERNPDGECKIPPSPHIEGQW